MEWRWVSLVRMEARKCKVDFGGCCGSGFCTEIERESMLVESF